MTEQTTRDRAFMQAMGQLIKLRSKQAAERGESTVDISDTDNPQYRWFFDAGVDWALRVATEATTR